MYISSTMRLSGPSIGPLQPAKSLMKSSIGSRQGVHRPGVGGGQIFEVLVALGA